MATEEVFELDEVVYTDSTQGLLQVSHDMEALAQLSGEEWRKRFDARRGKSGWNQSGVWSKREWVLPHLEEEDIVSLNEGWSSLLKPSVFNGHIGLEDVWVKLCGNGHSGSFKDLGMTALISQVHHLRKKGKPIRAVACASTGDTSAALSAYAAFAGIPSLVFLPKGKITLGQLIQPISNGAMVLALDTDFDGCMRLVREITTDKEIYLANSMNPLRIEGQKTVGIEICQQFGWEVPDTLIIPGGNLGNVSALGDGFEMMLRLGLIDKRPRIVVAQAEKANPLFLSYQNNFSTFQPIQAGETQATAIRIGNPVSYPKAVRTLKSFSGLVVQVSEEALGDAAHLADRSGLYCCPQTGVALAALLQLAEKKIIDPEEKVVVISTAHGLKFSEFKTNYHDGKSGYTGHHANAMVECHATMEAVMAVLSKKLP